MANAIRGGLANNILKQEEKKKENECEQNGAAKRIITIHEKCGGNIVRQGKCTWCEKCMKYFCGHF